MRILIIILIIICSSAFAERHKKCELIDLLQKEFPSNFLIKNENNETVNVISNKKLSNLIKNKITQIEKIYQITYLGNEPRSYNERKVNGQTSFSREKNTIELKLNKTSLKDNHHEFWKIVLFELNNAIAWKRVDMISDNHANDKENKSKEFTEAILQVEYQSVIQTKIDYKVWRDLCKDNSIEKCPQSIFWNGVKSFAEWVKSLKNDPLGRLYIDGYKKRYDIWYDKKKAFLDAKTK